MYINYTGSSTDFAINGEGFFVVGSFDTSIKFYTRNGDFTKTEDGYLATHEGKYVLGYNIENQKLEPVQYKRDVQEYRIAIAVFEQPETSLIWIGNSMFQTKDESVIPTIIHVDKVIYHALEIDKHPAEEFVELVVKYKREQKEEDE